jgi:precorrin-4/cobalt-precorrin-4 C11-methyltransferase
MAAHGCSLAIYLSAALSEEVSRTLSQVYGPESPIAVVQRATWPDERILMTTAGNLAADLAKVGIKRQALILAGPAVAAMQTGYRKGRKSKLYDEAFSHGWRKDASGEQSK